jgi:hypothetical protein
MRVGVICGDGLPVSGLLTIFRNLIDLGQSMGMLEFPVPADLGFSWRPDKRAGFPGGCGLSEYPPWLRVAGYAAKRRMAHLSAILLVSRSG